METNQALEAGRWDFVSEWWFILVSTNAVIGLLWFEYAWAKLARYRDPIKELDELLPAYRRDDALKWSKLWLYPGAVTVLMPRMILMVVSFLLCVMFLRIALVCHDHRQPLSGFRKGLVRCIYYVNFRFTGVFALFTWHTYRYMNEDEVDYSEYLGTNGPLPPSASLGSTMKDFYCRINEHSSEHIRRASGQDFVSQGSQHLTE